MNPSLCITEEEARLIIDVIALHTEGLLEAKLLTVKDPTIASAEQLCDLMSGYDDDLSLLKSVQEKLCTFLSREK